MNRREFLKFGGGALGLSTAGYYFRTADWLRLRDAYDDDVVDVVEMHLHEDAQVRAVLQNTEDEPMAVYLVVEVINSGEVAEMVDWPDETIRLEPEEEKEVIEDLGDSIVWRADEVQVGDKTVNHADDRTLLD